MTACLTRPVPQEVLSPRRSDVYSDWFARWPLWPRLAPRDRVARKAFIERTVLAVDATADVCGVRWKRPKAHTEGVGKWPGTHMWHTMVSIV